MNKTPGASVVVIESERKSARIIVGLFLIGLLMVSGYVLYQFNTQNSKKITIGGEHFLTEVADTPMARERGLSGRTSLASDHAMMFTFESGNNECFWMRDMQFNIDMVWLDSQNKITAIERNVSPATYPKNFCHDGLHVIEFTAGTADRLHLKVGDQADL